MGVLLQTAALLMRRHWARWLRQTARAAETQHQLLRDIIRRNRTTRFGRDHRFDTIRSLKDFRSQVEIGDYERLRPYVERVKQGETGVLTQEPVLMFAMTSGSTGEPKMIPITEPARRNHRRLTRLWYYRAYLDHPDLFAGRLLGVVSPAVEGRTLSGIPFGAASGLVYQSSPRWVQRAFAVPYEVSLVKEFEAKYYLIMRLGLEYKISFIGTPNPSTVLRLVETADRCKQEIIKDIRDGTIARRWEIAGEIREKLKPRLSRNGARAAWLENLAGRDAVLRPRDYWPSLRLIGCWKGGTVGVRLKEYARWFDEQTPVRDLGYMASEAQMTLPISSHGSAGILDISGNFYEFIPEAEIASANPVTLGCAEVREGETYYPVLTTPGGLYRYDINDVVRVAGFFNQAPLIEFVRKGRDVTNITGEKLHVNQVIHAMDDAQRVAAVRVRHFRACADTGRSRYRFMVEFDAEIPPADQLCLLLEALDRRLYESNVEYAQKRQSCRLAAPLLHVMKMGWFERRESNRLRQGARDTQIKARLLSDEPEDETEILDTIETPRREA